MVYDGKGSYRCQSRWQARREDRCVSSRHISEKKVERRVHSKLLEMLAHDFPDLLALSDEKPNLVGRIDALKQELVELQLQASNLVVKQAQAHSALSSIYDEQLQIISERIAIVEQTLAQTERVVLAQDTSGAVAAFHDLPANIEDMWDWEDTAINQLLHRLMGQRRLVLKDGEVIKTQDAPPHPRRKERKRSYLGKVNNS